MQVFVIIDSQTHIALDVNPSDRVLYVKAKINEIIGYQMNQFQVTYQGQVLENDHLLEHYSIGPDSGLRLNIINQHMERNMRIIFKTLRGNNGVIMVNPNFSIEDVKRDIAKQTGIKSCSQRLVFAGKQLEDTFTLQDYNIQPDSTIAVLERLRGGKPVIYLYPEKDNFDVNVKVDMKKEDGEITSIYPVIKESNNKIWIVKANKNGEIVHNGRKHYYLFWECLFNKSFKMEEGFVIEGNKCYEFFEEKLQYLGLKENEANDFITYWCPKMEKSNFVLINFQDEDYDKRAPLSIEPKPDSIKRIFMTFKLLEEKISVSAQNLEKFRINERKGFFVLEWGGSEVK